MPFRSATAGRVASATFPAEFIPAAAHHLAELKIVWPLLQPGSIVAVDDNRNGHGKGEQVAAHMAALGVPEIISGYVRAWKVQ